MSATTSHARVKGRRKTDPRPVRVYSIAVVGCFLALVAATLLWLEPRGSWSFGLLGAWVAVAALADTLRVRLWDDFSFAMSLPVTLAAGMVLSPTEAAIVAFFGAFDRRDFTGEIPVERVLLNRAMAGLSIYAGSTAFHSLAVGPTDWPLVVLASSVAYGVDFIVNVALVAFPVSRLQGVTIRAVVSRVLEPTPSQTMLIYVCVGLLSPVIALVSSVAGVLGVAVLLLPLGLARNAYLQLLRLHETAQRLHAKNTALHEATRLLARERRDERMVLAGELHDEVLPPLYKVHLMGQVLRQDLAHGRLLQLDDDLPVLLAATEAAQVAVRGVVHDLRGSPLGVDGLASTVRLFADQLEASHAGTRIRLALSEVDGSETSLLVVYQVAREALENAVRHSHSTWIDVRLAYEDDRIRLVVADDGVGFESRTAYQSGHFGLSLMRERVEAVGGNLAVVSARGAGTVIAIAVPPDA